MATKEEEPHFCILELDGVKSEIVISDLESVLQKSMGEKVTLIHYRTSSLVPLDENYGSKVTKMIACIKLQDSRVQKLSLMANLRHASRLRIRFIDNSTAFTKEIFFYETLLPAYEKLYGNDCVLGKISPKYYGGRLTMCQDFPDIADDDAILLTENLKDRGYYTAQKYYGLDFDHAKMAITSLARFHALGMVIKLKNPELFDAARNVCDVKNEFYEKNTYDLIDYLVNIVCNDKVPTLFEYKKKVRLNMLKNNWKVWACPNENVEPWVTIIHGDFWINNILFHNTFEGDVDDAKIIDFQFAKTGSPQADLIFFLCGSLDYEALEDHFDELIDVYYDKLIEVLQRIGAYTTALSAGGSESFYQHLKEVARTELFHSLVALKLFTYGNLINFNQINSWNFNELFDNRAQMVVLKFIEKNWL